MSDRYTRKDAYAAFARLASALGKTWSDERGKLWFGRSWEPVEQGDLWVRDGNVNRCREGAWTLDYAPIYGGFVVHQMSNNRGGVSEPFGSMRRNAREFCAAVRFAIDALQIADYHAEYVDVR